MKKVICIMIALVICMSLTVPVLAAGEGFVPSISEKDGPVIVPTEDEQGNPVLAPVVGQDGEVLDYAEEDCLVITPISKADTSEEIPDASKTVLLTIYDQLKDGTMKIPYEELFSAKDTDEIVIRDLVDVTWLCEDHPDMLAPAGVTTKFTFDLGVGKNDEVFVMTYKRDEWHAAQSVKNNGDGTVTCEFEEFCPVAFAVRVKDETMPPKTGDDANLGLWVGLLVVSAVALTAVLTFRKKQAQ